MKFKWRVKRRFGLKTILGKGWTEWHDDTLDEFVFRFKHIPNFNENEKHPDKIYWTFQFKDFSIDNKEGIE